MSDSPPRPCELCGRVLKTGTSQHHLIPRTVHSNKWFKKRFKRTEMQKTVDLCRDCHREIHRLIPSAKELGRQYYSLELLRAHPQLVRYLDWVRQQK